MSLTNTKVSAVLPVFVLAILSIHLTAGAPRRRHNQHGKIGRSNDVHDNHVRAIHSEGDVDTKIMLLALQNLVDEIPYMMHWAKNTNKLWDIYSYIKRRGGKDEFMKYMEEHLKKLNSYEDKNHEDNRMPATFENSVDSKKPPPPAFFVDPNRGLMLYGPQ